MKIRAVFASNQWVARLWISASVVLAIVLFSVLTFGLGGVMNVYADPLSPGGVNADPPRIYLNYAHDWVGVETSPFVAVTVTVVGKATIVGTSNDHARFNTDEGGSWDPERPDIQPGDAVTASVADITAMVNPIGEIEIEPEFDLDTISGTIHADWFTPTLLEVHCEIWEEGGPKIEVMGVNPDGGSYFCDFSTVGWDLQPEQMIAVQYVEPDNDAVINIYEEPEQPWVRVNYEHDWAGANYDVGHTFWVTVTDSAHAIKATTQKDTSVEGGWGGDGFQTEWEDWQPDGPDIRPGDWVYFKADDNYTNTLRVGEISGTVNIDTDSISGPIFAEWISGALDVECHPWGGWPGPAQVKSSSAASDGSVPYSCQWGGSEWDVQPGQDIAVLYTEPGSHDTVMSVFFGTAARYVAITGSDAGGNICIDPTTPCKTIKYALTQAVKEEQIWIAEGTYVENLTIDKSVDLVGGYEADGWTRDHNVHETIIDGNGKGTVIELQGGEADGLTLDGLTITGGNSEEAGGVYGDGANFTIQNCLIHHNAANGAPHSWGGGGVISGGNLIILDTRIISNTAVEGASGVRVGEGHLEMVNTLVSGNAGAEGLHLNGSAQLLNVTIVNNATDSGRPGINFNPQQGGHLNLVNSIIFGNGDVIHQSDGAVVQATYSDIEGGWSGMGNIDANPKFVDAATGDFRLQSTSPCIDSGTDINAPDHDLDQISRPQDGDDDGSAVTDMGAYEFMIRRVYLPTVSNSPAAE